MTGIEPGVGDVRQPSDPLEDPLERLETINSGHQGAKEEHNALGADVLLNWVEHATPNVFAAAARDLQPAEAGRPPPADPQPDHLERSRALTSLSTSRAPSSSPASRSGPILEGAGLNITVMSYRGVLNWGLMACRETVAGADEIAEAIPAALDELLAAGGPGQRVPSSGSHPRTRGRTPRVEECETESVSAATKAQARRALAERSKNSKAGATESGAAKGSAAKPGVTAGATVTAKAAKAPKAPKAKAQRPKAHRAETGPATAEPATAEPATAEPATAEPATAESAETEPVTSESATERVGAGPARPDL